MKTTIQLVIIIIGIIFSSKAQNATKYFHEIQDNQILIPTKSFYPNYQIKTAHIENEVLSFFKSLDPNFEHLNFKLVSKNESPYSKHFLFEQYIQNQKLYSSSLKINMDKNNKIYSIYYSIATSDIIQDIPLLNNPPLNLPEDEWVYILNKNSLSSAKIHTIKNPQTAEYVEEIYDHDQLIYRRDLNSYFAMHDTTINGYIFNPDPLTSSGNVYGGSIVDNNDSTTTFLNTQRINVQVRAVDTLGIFYLKSPFCEIVEADLPIVNPATSISNNFLFNRYENGFEDFNAYYYINTFHDYVNNTLGYSLVNYPINCDVHALNGQDNSLFTYSTTPPSLRLGEGNVDDAEDADVIIHEYCHAISHDAAPFTNIGLERSSLDEGFCDYLASSFSKSINPFHSNWVFNWDGHNVFWPGRIVDDTKQYPFDINANIYNNGSIWSSALWDIEKKLGREKANKLAIQTMYDNISNLSLHDAALNYLEADTLLYAGANYCKIINSFISRGLLDNSFVKQCDFTSVRTIQDNYFRIYNSEGFASGLSDLIIQSPINLPYSITLIDVNGKLILNKTNIINQYNLSSSILSTGVYFLEIHDSKNTSTFKLIKY